MTPDEEHAAAKAFALLLDKLQTPWPGRWFAKVEDRGAQVALWFTWVKEPLIIPRALLERTEAEQERWILTVFNGA